MEFRLRPPGEVVEHLDDTRLVGVEPEIARLVTEGGGRAFTVGWPGTWPATTSAGAVVARPLEVEDTSELKLSEIIARGG